MSTQFARVLQFLAPLFQALTPNPEAQHSMNQRDLHHAEAETKLEMADLVALHARDTAIVNAILQAAAGAAVMIDECEAARDRANALAEEARLAKEAAEDLARKEREAASEKRRQEEHDARMAEHAQEMQHRKEKHQAEMLAMQQGRPIPNEKLSR